MEQLEVTQSQKEFRFEKLLEEEYNIDEKLLLEKEEDISNY